MPRRTSDVDRAPGGGDAVKVVIITLDNHLASTIDRASAHLARDYPGLTVRMHAASDWGDQPQTLAACEADVADGDIILANMLFVDDQVRAIAPALNARRDHCDAMIGCLSAGEIVRLTRIGKLDMAKPENALMKLMKRLRGSGKSDPKASTGARQVAMLKRLPKILKFIPGTAQDLRAYFLTLQYWLSGSERNVENLIRFLVDRYAAPEKVSRKAKGDVALPEEYPEVGVYHPRLKALIGDNANALPKRSAAKGTVGLLVMRSYVLAGNTAHYDGVIEALEARDLNVVPAFASGLDGRPAIDAFFKSDHGATIDALVSLTGFSLVGGPAYNDAEAAAGTLAELDVPYVAAHAMEFQTLERWQASDRGLMPVENTIMVAIPELDGATGPMVFGGRSDAPEKGSTLDMQSSPERAEMLAKRVEKLVALRKTPKADRKVAAVLFNFPPNAGNAGTAAFLSVFASLHNTLKAMKADGYSVDVPETVDALRQRILEGNAASFGATANVHARIKSDDHVRRERYLAAIEGQWGPSPGRQQSDGATIHVLGAQFGNVFVGLQPGMGYEGDPMRLLFEGGFAPTHAFSAFYRWIREDFDADAVLHFGTHGALEFMPGKQAGMSNACWPDRLIGDLPNFYLYAANNPSEGAIAKRRSAATLISYLTPPLSAAGLYKGLIELKASIDHWRTLDDADDRRKLAETIQAQAAAVELADEEPAWSSDTDDRVAKVASDLVDLEHTLIPHGLHVAGETYSTEARVDMLSVMSEAMDGPSPSRAAIEALVRTGDIEAASEMDDAVSASTFEALLEVNQKLAKDSEMAGILDALDGRFIPPAPGGDLVRTPDILPTGRNIHGFDPFRLPSAHAMSEGASQAALLLHRYMENGSDLPETVALVLWGTDNLKTEGGPIGQALALMGARARFDGYGRLAGAELIPLEELGRPRIDVMMTLSGIFRDLLPLQTKLLAEAAFLAASADETEQQNFIAKHARAYAAEHGVGLDVAALRVFSNADGVYGSNVNLMVDAGVWTDESELSDVYMQRKSFAYGVDGRAQKQGDLAKSVLASVDTAYQNLESIELGVTTINHYFDTLGGISRAVADARGETVPVFIGDQTRGTAKVRTLNEQVALETRTRALNPKWYEGMLAHGYEGVRQIEEHVTNTMGWSATTGEVPSWVYQQLTETYVLDPEMRERLARLNPAASAKVANRLIEAHERNYWTPDGDVLDALREAGEEFEDRLEGIGMEAVA
ncbi:MAG: magnesium chelatase subunit H [Pseudomonadota bacterium]